MQPLLSFFNSVRVPLNRVCSILQESYGDADSTYAGSCVPSLALCPTVLCLIAMYRLGDASYTSSITSSILNYKYASIFFVRWEGPS